MKSETIYTTKTASGLTIDITDYALASAVNELAAEGAVSFCAKIKLLLPLNTPNSHIYAMKKSIAQTCREQGISLLKEEYLRDAALRLPTAVVTCSEKTNMQESEGASEPLAEHAPVCTTNTMHAGQSIVLLRWIGIEGMLRAAAEKAEDVRKRFTPAFLKQLLAFRPEIFASEDIFTLRKICACRDLLPAQPPFIRQVGEGGIFAALWRLADEGRTGLEVKLKKILIKQETIELCEFFHLNPYQLASTGTFLIVTDDGSTLADALCRQGVPAAVIGRLTDNNDKIIKNGEDIRYIDRPAPDEINKIFAEVP